MSQSSTKILRGALRSYPSPGGGAPGSFTQPCRKLVLQYNDNWPSSSGARDYVRQGKLSQLAQKWPGVEFVIQEKPHRHPLLRGFYVNGREKQISVRNLAANSVAEKVHLLLESSGRKLTNLKHRTVVAGAEESARGIWSALHIPRQK